MSKKRPNLNNISINHVSLGSSKILMSAGTHIVESTTLSGTIREVYDEPNTTMDVVNNLGKIFGKDVKGNFEYYRRAGKIFFRCEHNEGEEYSHLMKSLLKTILEGSMKKSDIHYNVTPNSASAIFR